MAHLALALALVLVSAAPASASELLLRDRSIVAKAASSTCSERSQGGAGTARTSLTAPANGYLTARLGASSGDWDLAVFRGSGGEAVAASAYRGATEVASGFVRRGDRLIIRACRRTGVARRARVSVALERIGPGRAGRRASLVRVATPTSALRHRLGRLGLDTTEHGGPGFVSVVLHGARDAARLRAAGFTYSAAVAAAYPRVRAAALPSGRTLSYRRLAGYGTEMKALALANPDLVKPITLAHTSRQGRPVEGLEITTNPTARDGKPVYLQLGLHHAREWPSGEHALEWAYELIQDYRAGDQRTRSLVGSVRTIIVPVVNPDGFNFSREDGQTRGHGGGFSGFNSSDAEFHRKNCSAASCAVNGGVDLNRNYGDLWGGPGASSNPAVETYRGTGPFSEPESQNIRELISGRQVVMMITNHTFGNEILRQPGVFSEGVTPDETLFKAVGEGMAAENGYANIFSYAIGDHVGTTDGWSYYTTGGLGYVIETGPNNFHPPYAETIQEYDGSAVPGGGNSEAFYVAMESAANPAHHAVLTGGAPAGAILRLTKSFTNRTSIGPFTSERFDTTTEVPASGRFEWHVNQSSRPLVPGERWTLTCERPEGVVQTTQEIAIVRGAAQELDLSACGPPPPPPPDLRTRPTVRLALAARLRGRVYRVRVTGSLRGVGDFERCDGAMAVTLLARTKTLRKRSAGLDERCRFERSFRIARRQLPRALRRKGARVTFRAVVRWPGNEWLAPAERSLRKRVRRP
jgi:zinc carboxypeptidase